MLLGAEQTTAVTHKVIKSEFKNFEYNNPSCSLLKNQVVNQVLE